MARVAVSATGVEPVGEIAEISKELSLDSGRACFFVGGYRRARVAYVGAICGSGWLNPERSLKGWRAARLFSIKYSDAASAFFDYGTTPRWHA